MLPNHPVKILVIGSGGREHALCWKLAQSSSCQEVYCAPGNGGTASEPKVTNVAIDVMDFAKILEFCTSTAIDLVVIGPDNPLAEGIVDVLEHEGLRVFGPRKESARLEWSKAFAKKFMTRFKLPTARYLICESYEQGVQQIEANAWARVVKVDGLALGKGVFVCDTAGDAISALKTIFQENVFGQAGARVVLEEKLHGDEVSLLALCDGTSLVPLLSCRDHKRRFDGDTGPNTGGMGAYAPVLLDQEINHKIDELILKPFVKALRQDEFFYKGVLYLGLMIGTPESDMSGFPQPYLLEFNARFGDPETQTILPLMTSDLLSALWSCTDGSLDSSMIRWSTGASCCVVATADTYPEQPSRGEPITITSVPNDVVAFHAGTMLEQGNLCTMGGRILAVTATAPSMEAARNKAYEALQGIKFKGMDYRQDIAKKVVASCPSA